MKVTNVKLLNDGASVDWQTQDHGTTVYHGIKKGSEASPAFQGSVSDLREDVQALMEYPDSYMETVTVKGLSVSYDDDGTMEASLSFIKRFKCGRAVGYSTKRVRQRTDHKENGTGFMTEELEAKVQTVIKEAERYVEGERAQTEH